MQKAPYWRIIETNEKRQAGNYVATADFENPELGLEDSLGMLRSVLNRLTPGRYILTSFIKSDAKRSGVDTWIEVEGTSSAPAAVSGVTQPSHTFLDGIGMVTLDNIGEAIEKKFAMEKKKEQEAERIKKLEEENARLKAEAREHETGFNKGVLSIGSIVWNMMRDTPAGKEVIGMMGEFKKMGTEPGAAAGSRPASSNGFTEAEVVDENVSGTDGDVPQGMVDALDVLAKDNPDLVPQLQMLAKVKQDNPDLFQDAIENLKIIAG